MSILAALINPVSDLLKEVLPDTDKRAALAHEIATLAEKQTHEQVLAEIEQAKSVIVAEANSDSWIASNWRPITMLVFTGIVANNYILYPYLSLFWTDAPVLDLPPFLWETIKIGLGGYVVGRSGEKMVKAWKSDGS